MNKLEIANFINTIGTTSVNQFSWVQAIGNLSAAIRKGDSEETFNQILSLTSSTISTLNSYANIIGTSNPKTDAAALISSAVALYVNVKTISADAKNGKKINLMDVQNVIGDTFALAGDTLGLVAGKNPGAKLISTELNNIGLAIKAYGAMTLGNSKMDANDLFNAGNWGRFVSETVLTEKVATAAINFTSDYIIGGTVNGYGTARDFTSRYIIEGAVNSYNQAVNGLSDGMIQAEQAYKYAESSFESAYNGLKDTAGQLVEDAQNLVKDLYDQTKETANEKITDLQNKIGEFQKTVGEVHQSMVENASRKIEEGVDFAQEMGRKISDAAEALSEQVKKTAEDIGEWGKDAVESSLNAVRDFANKASKKAKEFSDAARDAAKQAGEAAEDFADAARKFFDGLPDFGKAWEEFKKSYPNLFPDSQGWYDNGHQCLAPWAKELNRDGKYYVYDPLALDLDGDGIETVATNGFTGTLFDHMGSGIRTATGWISADDGLLVRDINGNGIIDNGTELFGDNTKLKNGGSAQHGFAALADLDSNGDKVIDAKDAAFKELRVWRDINQDGISQNNELFTLQSLGIKSFNTAYTNTRHNLGNGNTLVQKGSYTKADGTNAVMGDLELAADKIYSDFTDKVELTAAQAEAPNLKGTGRLRDLREAAALSDGLSATLKAYTAANTREAQLKLLDSLVLDWAKTDPQWGKKINFGSFAQMGTRTQNEGLAILPSKAVSHGNVAYIPKEYQAALDALLERIAVLDAYTGIDSENIFYTDEADAKRIVGLTGTTYENLAANIYKSLLFQTRLKSYIEQIDFKIERDTFGLDYRKVVALFKKVHTENPNKAFADLGEFLAYGSFSNFTEGADLMGQFIEDAKKNGTLETMLASLGKEAADILGKHTASDNDRLLWGIDFGGKKNTVLRGSKNGSTLIGGIGDDTIEGNYNNDKLYGGSGNDTLTSGWGNDLLDGGDGDDKLEGGGGADTYVFSKGHGRDVLLDHHHSASDGADTVRFTDVSLSEVKFRKENNDLILSGYHGDDSLRIRAFFERGWGGERPYEIERFEFADQTVLLSDLYSKGMSFHGSDDADSLDTWSQHSIVYAEGGDDVVSSGGGDDKLYGGSGNDTLKSGSGNDLLDGGDGDDKLDGGEGKDILIGGRGNDFLEGGRGADTYVFSKGHGRDVLLDHQHSVSEGADTVRFTDVSLSEVKFRKENYDLILSGYHGDDSLRIRAFFEHGWGSERPYEIERFEFADRTIDIPGLADRLSAAENLTQAMSAFGSGSASTLSGTGTEITDNRPLLATSAI